MAEPTLPPTPTTLTLDAVTFARLYERYATELRDYVRHALGGSGDADDVAAEAWLRMWRSRDRFTGAVAPARDPEKLWLGWAYRIAHNLMVDRARHAMAIPMLPLDEELSDWLCAIGPRGSDPYDTLPDVEQTRATLAALSPPYRETLVAGQQGYSHPEIAAKLGISSSAVKMRALRARAAFREVWERHEANEGMVGDG